jgi:hypothetical protein
MPAANRPQDEQERDKFFMGTEQAEVAAHAFATEEQQDDEERDSSDVEGHIFAKPEDEIFLTATPEDEERDGQEVKGHIFARPEDEDDDGRIKPQGLLIY